MSQSPGFPSTWATRAGITLRVPGIGQAVSLWLLFHQPQLSPTYPIRKMEKRAQQGLGRDLSMEGGGVVTPRCCGSGLPSLLSALMLSWLLQVTMDSLLLVHQKLLTGDCSDMTGLLQLPMGFHFRKMMPRSRAKSFLVRKA